MQVDILAVICADEHANTSGNNEHKISNRILNRNTYQSKLRNQVMYAIESVR